MKNYVLLLVAIALDLIIGDPITPLHPVRLIGSLIIKIETLLYPTRLSKRISGFLGVILSMGIVFILFISLYRIAGFIQSGKEVFSILIFYFTIAIKDLADHGMRVKTALDNNDVETARKQLSMIVSRDTKALSREAIVTSTVESISENASDSIIAPIFWGLIFGPPGALAYRVINTLDAMWGYKNEKYINFGRSAALVDDAVNFLPARLTGMLICLASPIISGSPVNTWKIMRKDHDKTESPNSGYPEAAMAGALGVQLGGEVSYFGKTESKPTMGEKLRDPLAADISYSIRIIAASAALFLIVVGIILITRQSTIV